MTTLTKIALLAALVLIFSPALGAGTKSCPVPGPAVEESYTWNFSTEVTKLLHEIEHEAPHVSEIAATLDIFIRMPFMFSKVSHAAELNNAKGHVNKIGDRLCRLHQVRRMAEPGQRKTMDELKVTFSALATDTERAIEFLNDRSRPTNLVDPVYGERLAGIYRESSFLRHISEMTWQEDLP